ncbi:uncharacterized protein PF11_0213-like isoform X2 [Myzus persicae]|uniref:uncharacterized protein PF11_0213-like isoform X2 n=1 Tax=Myzus persicae TaxID=13164 RepID=UPI000B9345F7|nr:uncharacterized protein PF11_0213-like isoform X2 [Myzus persicae]
MLLSCLLLLKIIFRMDTNKPILVENEYDDGVVCFGPVTEDQLNRYNRLPRRTVLPSDFELSQSFFEQDEDKKNDQSTVLDESNENTTTSVDNSINITISANNFDEEKEIGTMKLKQSFPEDSNSKFSSPCFSKCMPNAKLMDTEVINRYIRMRSTSSSDSSLSEDQNKSTFEDETISFTDAQEIESIQDNDVFDKTSTCEHLSISSVIEQGTSSSQQNVINDSINVCTLIHCSQKDDADLSICSDSELGDVTEDSIVADEYSVTPGKQRLFDLRVTKQSLRAKALVASAPFMDRIEETTTPIMPTVLNSTIILNKISDEQSEIKERLNVSTVNEICHDKSTEHLNQTSNEHLFETSKFVDETVGESLVSSNLKNMVSVNKSVDSMFDETINTNQLSTDSRGMNINKSLIKTDQVENTLNDTVPKFDNEQSMNIKTNISIPTDVNYHYGKEYLHGAQIDTKSSNTGVEDKIFDETLYTNELPNNRSMDLNQSLNETDHIQTAIKDTEQNFDDETMYTNKPSTDNRIMGLNQSLNETEHNFDDEKSMCIISNKAIPTSDLSYYNNEEFSVAMEVDIKSTNTSYVDKEFDDTTYTNKLSTDNRSMDLNQSLNETNVEYTLNDTKQTFDGEKSNITIPTSDVNHYNDEEFSVAMEVDIKSTNTSYVDKEFDDTMYTNKLSTDNRSMDLNQSLNETTVEYTSNDTKQTFDGEKSNITIPTSVINHYNNEEFSVAMEVDIKSTSSSCVVKEINETVCTHKLSFNNQNTEQNDDKRSTSITSNIAIPTFGLIDLNDKEENSIVTEVDIKSIDTSVVNKILDETLYTQEPSINNQNMNLNETNIENTLNDTKHKVDDEKTINVVSNMSIPTTDVKGHNNEEENSIVTEVDIKSFDTSVVNKISNEALYTHELSINKQNMDLNKSLKETNIENTSNDTELKFDDEKSMNVVFNMSIPTTDVKGHNNEEEYSIVTEVDIKSIDTSVVNKIFDETLYTQELSINNQNMDLNKSLKETNIENTSNDTELKFDDEKSMNIMSNMATPTSDVKGHNNEAFSVAMEVDITSTNTSCVDKELDESVYANKLVSNDQSIILDKSLNDTEHKFDDEKSMNVMSNMAIATSDVNDHNDKENSIATKIDIKSINTSIVDKIFDESMLINANKILIDSRTINCNKSLNETRSASNITEHRFKNNIQNTSVSAINFDDNLVLNKLDKSILKTPINSDTSFVGINEVDITCNTSLEDPSCRMRQYLDFEQAVNEMCNDISSASCPDGKSNQPKESLDDETIERLIEQTLSSDTFNVAKVNENFSNYVGPNLSVIIEDNKSLETSRNNTELHEDSVNSNNDIPITLESESTVNEVNDTELLNKSTVTTSSKSEVGLAYGTDVNIQIKANETKHNGSPMFSDELSKIELHTFTQTNKNLNNIPEDVNEVHLIQDTSDENDLNPIANQITAGIPNSADFKLISNTEITQKNLTDQDELLNNDNQQQDLLDATTNIDSSLEEFTNLEQMFDFGDNKKEKQVEYKTPKTEKLLDFSIVQQTPTFDNEAKKQKVLNFSIVDPTPILKKAQQIYPNENVENVIKNASLIRFSSADEQMWNSEVVTKNEINFKDFQNSNDSSLNNLSTISPPDLELLPDESIKANTSSFSNSSFDQTITDSNLNLPSYSCANSITELNNVEPLMFINKQIASGEPSNSLNQTIEQSELKHKMLYGEHCVAKASTTGLKSDLKLLSNTTLNKNIDFVEFKEDSNQQLRFNSNEQAIVDFSIIDQRILENFESKKKTDQTSVESDSNVSNLIEMSLVSKSDDQSNILSKNQIIPIISDNKSEKSMQSSSDDITSTALHLEESSFLHNNTELLTDVQMNDESLLMESPEKSSIVDSFHSIELDHVQEDNKRKTETTREHDNINKKMKVEESETLKTPMSMLYKIKNMFRSSEKQPSRLNNTKENNFKSDKCYQKLNFNKFEENNDFAKPPITLKKSEVTVKSKIPCKVTDRSLAKNDEFNSSSLSSLNDSIKQKKTIPKFSGVPVLSDVSNSSNRKCPESRIPSKFQK